MQFGLSEEQTLLQDNVNRFLKDNVPLDRVRAYAEGGDDSDIWQGLAELGLAALLVPEDQGGIGLGALDAAIVAECLGYHVAPAPFLGTAVMAPTALSLSEGDHSELLGQIIAGEKRVGIAFGEAVDATTPGLASKAAKYPVNRDLHSTRMPTTTSWQITPITCIWWIAPTKDCSENRSRQSISRAARSRSSTTTRSRCPSATTPPYTREH